MARGVNKVILVGNLGKDPEVRYMPSGGAVANLTLATTESWRDKEGQQQERTEWHNVVFYNKLAEIVGEYLKKGSQVYVEGSLRTRKWQDKNGLDRYTTEIIAGEMQMLGGGGGRSSAGNNPPASGFDNDDSGFARSNQSNQFSGGGRPQQAPAQNSNTNSGFDSGFPDMDDDIPF